MPHHVSQNQSHQAPNKSGKNIGAWCVCVCVCVGLLSKTCKVCSIHCDPGPPAHGPPHQLRIVGSRQAPICLVHQKVRHRARQKVATSSSSQPPMNLVPKKRQRPGSLKLPRPGSPTDSEFLVPDNIPDVRSTNQVKHRARQKVTTSGSSNLQTSGSKEATSMWVTFSKVLGCRDSRAGAPYPNGDHVWCDFGQSHGIFAKSPCVWACTTRNSWNVVTTLVCQLMGQG